MKYENRKEMQYLLTVIEGIEYLENDLVDSCKEKLKGKYEGEVRNYFGLSTSGNEVAVIAEYLINKKLELIKLSGEL